MRNLRLNTEPIRQTRINKQLPQRKVANAVDIDQSKYCDIEHNRRRVDFDLVVKLSECLNLDVKDLILR